MNNAEDSNEIQEGVNWLTWTGYYGNKKLDDDANGQFCAFGQCRYTDGPLGKFLLRHLLSLDISNTADCRYN